MIRFKINPTFFGFLIPVLFWVYLLSSTKMDIRYDAAHFEKLGKIIHSEGWDGFFKQGPTLEPLYPFIISQSLNIEAASGIPYQKIQAVIQMTAFFAAQLLLFQILKILKINPKITLGILIYFGISPGLTNAGFSLFSEIITFPFILGCIILSVRIWEAIQNKEFNRAFINGLIFTILATTITFSKAILEYVFILFVLPFIYLLIKALFQKDYMRFKCSFIFLVIFFIVSQGSLYTYKSINQKYNGHFAFTDFRGPYMFYQYAVKRTRPLTQENVLVPLLSIPGEHVCRSFFKEACQEWWYDNYSFAVSKEKELIAQGMTPSNIYPQLYKLGLKQALLHPFKYGVFTSFEALKMFFWESTKVGFVYYPTWITELYDNFVIKNILRLAVFVATLTSVIYLILSLSKQFHSGHQFTSELLTLSFSVYFVLIFISLYSSVITITRYAFPIASLYLIFIAFFIQSRIKH